MLYDLKIIFKIQVKSCGKLRFLHWGEKWEPLAREDTSLFWACLMGTHSMTSLGAEPWGRGTRVSAGMSEKA